MNSCHNNLKISLENISKFYGDTKILENINIEVYEGEIVSIIGPSGCGKSTIFNIITKLVDYEDGKVTLNGKFSYMHQKDLLLPYKTIIDNVSMPLILKKEKKSKAYEFIKPYFNIFGLDGYEDKYPSELSGGMKQRANFMRTFINSNDIMLLDEPFGALDSITKSSMQNWVLEVVSKLKPTILMITHDIEEAIILSNRIYIMSNKPSTIINEYTLDKNIYNNQNLEKVAKLKKEILSNLK